MKFLTVCAGGNIRSRAAAYRLMYHHDQDALSASADKQPEETFRMLCAWADRIVIMQPQFVARIPAAARIKVVLCDVGEDNYGSPWHFELQEKVKRFLDIWAKNGFAL